MQLVMWAEVTSTQSCFADVVLCSSTVAIALVGEGPVPLSEEHACCRLHASLLVRALHQ